MKKYLLILILFIYTLISSCTLPEQNQGNNNNQNDIYYKVSFDSNFGSFVDSQEIKEGELAIKPVDPIKENFRFLYWTLNNEEYDFNTPVTSNIILVALWEKVEVHTHFYTSNVINPSCTEKGYTEYICSCGYTFKDNYTDELGHEEEHHPAKSPISTEIGWEAYITCNRCTYSTYKELPATGIEIYEKDGKKFFNFGSYPQTHVNDIDLINELNKLTIVNSRGYYEYNGCEYKKIVAKPFKTGKNFIYSTGSIIVNDVVEWFKVEPIVWRILATNNNAYQVLSEYIIDTNAYNQSGHGKIDGETIYANNYKYSDIRYFLNYQFFNKAFVLSEQNLILTTEVDNSVSTTSSSSNPYVCENTFDKIYLLSYKDLCNRKFGFNILGSNSDSNRVALVTDYAKANGICCNWPISPDEYNYGGWWLRSPYEVINFANYVNTDGSIYSTSDLSYPSNSIGSVFNGNIGIRPSMSININ